MPMWGKRKLNGVWFTDTHLRRVMWRDHDSLFIARGRFRLRLMKPWSSW